VVVRELVALLGVKSDTASMNKAEGGLDKIKLAAQAVAVAVAAIAAVKWAKQVAQEIAEVGDRFDKLSKRTGIATKELQGWEHAAELSGASLGDVEAGLRRLQAAQADAGFGLKTYTREFDRLGVDIKDASGDFKDTTQLMYEIADGMKNLGSDTERTAAATKLLGRGGARLIPMFKEGGDKVREMVEEMSKLHAVMDEDLIQASADWIDNQRRMDVVIRSAKMAIAKELLPFMNEAAESVTRWWEANGDWIKQDIGEVFKSVGSIVSSFGKAVAGVVKRVVDFWESLSKTEKGMLGLQGAIVAIGVLLSAGPIGKFLLLASIIGLLIDDFIVWREGGDSAIGRIIEKLNEWLDIDIVAWVEKIWISFSDTLAAIVETVTAVADFLINVWSDPEAAWLQFIEMMKSIWGEWWEKFREPILEELEWLKSQWEGIVTWFEESIIAPIANAFKGLWDDIIGGVKDVTGWLGDLGGKVAGFFGGGGPEAAAPPRVASPPAGRGGSQALSQNTKIDVNVNASPGMNEGQLAVEVGRQVKKQMDRANRDAMGAFVPQAATPVPGV